MITLFQNLIDIEYLKASAAFRKMNKLEFQLYENCYLSFEKQKIYFYIVRE